MHTGEIIRFYREKAGMTQSELGEGICTTTHVSKIERGKTAYSNEIISLFSERLGIDIHHEIETILHLEKQLHLWHNSIIMRRMNLVEKIKSQLEKSAFLESSKYGTLYHLLRARYYILHQKADAASSILDSIKPGNLPAFETNLFYHVQGIININRNSDENQQKAINALQKIIMNDYQNLEYYYHVSIAYHCVGNRVMAYFYAEKALGYFKETNNYLGSIKAESLMLLQLSGDQHMDAHHLAERYQNLIEDCDSLGFLEQKGMLLNNLGYEYYNRGDFSRASRSFKEALKLAEKGSLTYLRRLCNYTDACMEGKLCTDKQLEKHIHLGLQLSKSSKSTLFLKLFELFSLQLKHLRDEYMSFLENEALPHFLETNNLLLIERYGNVLYEHYVESDQLDKAILLTRQLKESR
ncbi:helix-turn-helix domain-containing protein [Rossellomorea vietnamensis]|uniref:helix-turn-helix domain-containing protein n=1 Tax=Rossellomorea vietnamensis TaxID=218284 RepID=UPI001CCBE874|nr:helix-turn-helix transcriptional regulator [Rossellomorea vietnamensis]MCA0150489.1 helix-turn-helix domain-containing protein [Rossellomorea vietnamensis]